MNLPVHKARLSCPSSMAVPGLDPGFGSRNSPCCSYLTRNLPCLFPRALDILLVSGLGCGVKCVIVFHLLSLANIASLLSKCRLRAMAALFHAV